MRPFDGQLGSSARLDPKVLTRLIPTGSNRQRAKRYLRRKLLPAASNSSVGDDAADTPTNRHEVVRESARALWREGQRVEALEQLRLANATYGNDDKTWTLYGARLLDAGREDAAFEAIKTAVDLQPLNFRALDLLLEVCSARRDSDRYVRRAIDRLSEAIGQRPQHHRTALGYLIPGRSTKGLDAIRESPDPVVRLAVELNDATIGTDHWSKLLAESSSDDATTAQLLCFLARGRQTEAYKILETLEPDDIPVDSLRPAIRRELRRGRKTAAHRLLKHYLRARPDDVWAQRRFAETKAPVLTNYQLATAGYPLPSPRSAPTYEAVPDRVFYLLHNSLPYHSAGYATRTHGLLTALRGEGWDVAGITRLGYPFDMPGRESLPAIPPVDLVDGVPYHRLSKTPVRELKRPLQEYIRRYTEALIPKATHEQPFVIHGASNHWNGLAAVTAAGTLGIPSVYEVRGLWEVTRGSRDPEWATGGMYRFMARMEADAAAGASAVITITEALRDELIRRGIDGSKITVVPNGVDTTRFRPRQRNESLAESLGIGGKTIIGYVGSILDYEGIGLLIRAVEMLSRDRDDFAVLIVGDGAELDKFRQMTEDSQLQQQVIFTGRVPHSEVEDYYSIIDIAPFPRLPLPVCEIVSPLKPFEAMAMGKAVVSSDVAALSEIVRDGVTGLLHTKGDVSSLANALARLLDDSALRLRLADNSRQWVEQKRDWRALAPRVSRIYENLGGKPHPVGGGMHLNQQSILAPH